MLLKKKRPIDTYRTPTDADRTAALVGALRPLTFDVEMQIVLDDEATGVTALVACECADEWVWVKRTKPYATEADALDELEVIVRRKNAAHVGTFQRASAAVYRAQRVADDAWETIKRVSPHLAAIGRRTAP